MKDELDKSGFIESPCKDGMFIEAVMESYQRVEIYLTESVTEGATYTKIEHTLRNLTNKDIVNFYIGNYGGSCHGLIHLVSAVRATKAKAVNMIVVSPSYSAASTLALVGTSLRFEPHTFLMFHNYSSSTGGKGGELLLKVAESDAWIKKYFKDLHQPFLTLDECKKLEDDKDIYIHFDDKMLKTRIERHFKKGK